MLSLFKINFTAASASRPEYGFTRRGDARAERSRVTSARPLHRSC